MSLVDDWLVMPPGRVNHVAFGTFCHIAVALRDTRLRRWAGPFDWIFSSPGLIADCLEDDFATLLDPGQLRSVPEAELTFGAKRQCRHPLYEERHGLPPLFNHHDPALVPADAAALHRSVRRLRLALGTTRRNALYMMSETRRDERDIERLAALMAPLPSRNELVILTTSVAPGRSRTERRHDLGNVAVREVELGLATASLGIAYPDPADDADLREVLGAVAREAAVRLNESRGPSG
ncbi:hypothetical protein [uncultured Enterovirga sp.]|uniref:hypothetical protein n=1 Tax=uncultured Enterovirga sp. TaxID=2026352 RepID=UPI0035CB8D30